MYEVEEKATRKVEYADRFELEREIIHRRDVDFELPPTSSWTIVNKVDK